MTSAIARLIDFGQSPWYDNLTRALVTRRRAARSSIDDDGIRGVTSNPTIFEKAIGAGERLRRRSCASVADGRRCRSRTRTGSS